MVADSKNTDLSFRLQESSRSDPLVQLLCYWRSDLVRCPCIPIDMVAVHHMMEDSAPSHLDISMADLLATPLAWLFWRWLADCNANDSGYSLLLLLLVVVINHSTYEKYFQNHSD